MADLDNTLIDRDAAFRAAVAAFLDEHRLPRDGSSPSKPKAHIQMILNGGAGASGWGIAVHRAGYPSYMSKHRPMDDEAKARIMSPAARHPESRHGAGRIRPAGAIGR